MELEINPNSDISDIGKLWREKRTSLMNIPVSDGDYVSENEFIYHALDKLGMGVAFVYDVAQSRNIFVSDAAEALTGYPKEEFMTPDSRSIFERTTDPQERHKILIHGQLVFFTLAALPMEKKLSYKTSMIFRFRAKSGKWLWIHLQTAPRKLDKFGNPIEMMGLAIPQPEGMQLHFHAVQTVQDEKGQLINLNPAFRLLGTPTIKFTPQEMKVLRHISQGFTSREIADMLALSQHTVDEYRSRMLKKSNSTNSAELISFSLMNGIL